MCVISPHVFLQCPRSLFPSGMEDVFYWSHMEGANEHYRGASGAGDGVHILTGPIYVEEAEVGDMLKVEILDLKPRKNPKTGKTYGSNAAAWWGFQARVKMVDGSDFGSTLHPCCNIHCVPKYTEPWI